MLSFIDVIFNYLSYLLLIIFSVTINAQLKYPFPNTVVPPYIDDVSFDLWAYDPSGPLQIHITINSTDYCLTDPDTTLQPRENTIYGIFATLEECREDNLHQRWRSNGTMFTSAERPDPVTQEPRLPAYAVNYTHFGSQSVQNAATGRCITGFYGYPGTVVKINQTILPSREDYYGFIYLSYRCEGSAAYNHIYNVRSALVGSGYEFKGEDANPRWTYTNIKEILYFDFPGLREPGRPHTCPRLPKPKSNNTQNAPRPYEAEYRTRTLIIPYLISLEINGTEFHPAMFGCTNNTDDSFPRFTPSLIEFGLNSYGDKVELRRQCREYNENIRKEYPNAERYKGYREEIERRVSTWKYCKSLGTFRIWNKQCLNSDVLDSNKGLINEPSLPEVPPDLYDCNSIPLTTS
ncbi:hypothetical protein TWF281_000453 [Arthrobotrys megalospora]